MSVRSGRFVRPALNILGFLVVASLSACGDTLPTQPADAPEQPPMTLATVAASTGWTVGSIAPDVSAFDVNDVEVSLADFAGQFVLLEVGGAWCAPTQFIAPFLPDVEQAMEDEGIPFTTVVTLVEDAGASPSGSTATLVQAWLDKFYGGAYRRVYHMAGSSVVADPWYVPILEHQAIPILFLLGPTGEVIQVLVGAPDQDVLLRWVREGITSYARPTIESVNAPEGPVSIDVPLVITGTYSDRQDDVATGSVDWGDGTSSALVVNADGTFGTPGHTYALAGMYTVDIVLEDFAGHTTTQRLPDITVYDPDGGFIAGAGSVISPDEYCSPTGCGPAGEVARFTLLAKYAKKATVPDGALRFRFESGSFAFESVSYEWLLVNRADTNAQLKGAGTVNGQSAAEWGFEGGDFRFMLRTLDGSPDTFQLEIWLDDPYQGEAFLYRNEEPLVLESGNIIVQTGR